MTSRRFVSRICGAAVILVLVFASGVANAQIPVASAAHRDAVAALSQRRGFATSTVWLAIGHWQQAALGGWHSGADAATFFLAPDGKTNPEAEFAATLAAVFAAPDDATPTTLADGVTPTDPHDKHAICRFPARLALLIDHLDLDPQFLPRVRCTGLTKFWQRVTPKSITLVFSAYYLSAPASAFGHTFLRFNHLDHPSSGRSLELLDHGSDFSAQVDTSNALLYAVKGLLGMFPGRFMAYPYFYKVREYNDFESRDLWEFDLALPPDRVALAFAHLWELGQTTFPYYYVSENCSWHVLGLLNAIQPHMHLLERIGWPVIPADTVKALARTPGLVREVRYRPSIRRQFHARIASMSGALLERVVTLAEHPDAPLDDLPTQQQAQVLDAATDYVDFRHAKELIPGDPTGAGTLRQRLMERRADLLVASPPLARSEPREERPDLGHDSRRMGIGMGITQTARPFVDLYARLALHDLGDPPRGYPELGRLEFLPTQLRFLMGRETHVRLESMDLVHVGTLVPVSRFSLKPSWDFRIGAATRHDSGCDGCLIGRARIGGGLAFASAAERVALFTLFSTELSGGPSEQLAQHVPFAIGAGPHLGVRVRWLPDLVTLAEARWLYYPGQPTNWRWAAALLTRWQALPGFGIGLDLNHNGMQAEASLTGSFYF